MSWPAKLWLSVRLKPPLEDYRQLGPEDHESILSNLFLLWLGKQTDSTSRSLSKRSQSKKVAFPAAVPLEPGLSAGEVWSTHVSPHSPLAKLSTVQQSYPYGTEP